MDSVSVAMVFFGLVGTYLLWFVYQTKKVKFLIFKLLKRDKLKRGVYEFGKIADLKGDEFIKGISANSVLKDFSAFEIELVEEMYGGKKNVRRGFNEKEIRTEAEGKS